MASITISTPHKEPTPTISTLQHVIVTPGETITDEAGYIRGHGTTVVDGKLVATVAGVVERVNKLISVRSAKSRYIGEVGDVVVGRITEVAVKRWKVDIGGHQDAVLQLSSIILPGAVQRKRTAEDMLQMRTFFEETHLISAEVQEIFRDGAPALHTRSLKYGRLENGQLATVPACLMRRIKQRFVTLTCGVDVILGANGYIWITRPALEDKSAPTGPEEAAAMPLAETLARKRKKHAETLIEEDDRARISRVHCCIMALRALMAPIYPGTIMAVVRTSKQLGLSAHEILKKENVSRVTLEARQIAGVELSTEEVAAAGGGDQEEEGMMTVEG